jgi:hypothetical protein
MAAPDSFPQSPFLSTTARDNKLAVQSKTYLFEVIQRLEKENGVFPKLAKDKGTTEQEIRDQRNAAGLSVIPPLPSS